MKDFLMDMFEINKKANLRMTDFITKLSDPSEPIRLLSHLANCQYKWLDRILVYPEDSKLDWWFPLYDIAGLKTHLEKSADQWIHYLDSTTEEEITSFKNFIGYDGTVWEAPLKDIALQLTFHSFHHRAQIQMLIRQQGEAPPFIDYIGYKAKKTGIN